MEAIGVVSRLLAVTVLVAGLSACGGGGSASSPSPATSESTETQTTSPSVEPSGLESPGSAATGVSLSLPSLPVGGSVDDQTAVHQCLDVNWASGSVNPGDTVAVTGFTFSGGFALDSGGDCSGTDCHGFTFTSSQGECFLAIQATAPGGPDAMLTLQGLAKCPTADRQWCENLKTSGLKIHLTEPPASDDSTPQSLDRPSRIPSS